MLYAYFDESGHEQKEDWMSVAGLVGTEDQWRTAASLWADAIKPRKRLHMSDLRFKHDRERRTLQRAGRVPDMAGLKPALAAVRVADYYDLTVGTDDERRLTGYMLCCYLIIINTIRGIPADERLEVTFENQKQYYDHASRALQAVAEETSPLFQTKAGLSKLAKWSFVPKGSAMRLEPADYYAYAVVHARKDPTSRRARWCSPILETNKNSAWGFNVDRAWARRIIRALVR